MCSMSSLAAYADVTNPALDEFRAQPDLQTGGDQPDPGRRETFLKEGAI